MAIKVQGITVIDDGRNIINGIGASFTGIVTANTFVGSGASLTNISNTALTNNSVTYGGVTVSLGGTDATPAFNLSDAINYPYTSLTGITTEIVGDITPQLGGNLDINSKFITGTGGINVTGVVTATSFSGSGANLTGLTGADAATYGDAFTVPQIVVNSDGKITTISNVTISGGGGGGGGISGVTIKEEGSVVGTSNSIRDINFVSDNLTASGSGVGATITFTSTPTFTSAVVGSGVTINSSGINAIGVVTATTFSGSGANLTSIPNGALTNSSIAIGGVTLNLGDTDATPAFDLSDATAYPTSSLSGTITNAQLAGSIVNAKLSNSSIAIGGVTLNLGDTDATPAFDLSDATAYPTSSLVGTITNAQLAGSIANAKLVNDSVSFGGVSLDLGETDATPAFDLSDATAYPYASLTGITTSIVGDTTPQLGGNLDINGKFITGTGGINVSGVITATTFSGNLPTTDLTGTITNAQLAGSIENAKLANSSIAIGGVTLNLGDTDATPAFNLSDATAYPYTSLTGITTEIVGDITPQLGGNLDINGKFIIGTGGLNVTGVVTASSLDAAISEWILGANGSSDYTFTGPGFTGAENDPSLYLVRGQKYRFKNSSGGHPFRIQSTPNGSTGTQYNDGITNNDAGNGTTLIWDLQFDAPEILYYQCTAHPNMGGKIYIGNSGESIIVGAAVTINSSGINVTGVVTSTTFSGSGASLTDIPNGALTNSSIVIGGVTLNLGDTDATPAFNLSDATAYPTSSLSGTITNAQLAGSIANANLVNSSIAIGGVTLNLGDTDATPAFNLSDATAYPYTSLTGITTSIVGDTTPQLGGNLDINGKFITGTGGINVSGVVTATTFDGNVTGNVTGGVSGNAGTATSLSSARNFSISGDVVASAVSFDGTGDVVLSTAIQPNSVALATDTTGDFVQSITGTTNEVTVSVTSGENSTPQIGLPNDVTIGQDLTVTRNIDVDGHTELDDVNVSGIITASSLNVTNKLITTGIGISIANGAGNTAYIEGPSEIWIDPHPFGVGQTSGSVRIRGDLYVDGTEFIVNVDKIQLGDFRIGIATTAGTNALLDGAGLGIGSESIEKTITWNNSTSALMSSENWNLASGKHYEINGTDVLTSNTLGSGIINSSLTSVGTLGALTVSGNVNANGNIVGDSATNISGINSVTATSFYGSGANLTSIPNGALTNSSIAIGGVTLNLGDTDATPAFDLSDATAYPTSSLSGTITNAQLAGSIANAKLANSSIAIGGVTLNLGDTDATPAFDLSDATAYPTSSLSGTITNAQLAGSIADGKLSSTFLKNVVEDTTPQLGGNLDINGKFITGTGGLNVTGVVTASSLDAAISEWILGADGSSNYTFTGPGFTGAENDPSLYLVRGQKYRFVNNSGGSHPFQIRNSNGGSAYSDGVTNNGAASGNIDWNVQFDTPNELYYQCTNHSSMGGKIYIGNSGESIVVGSAVTINSSGINVTGVVTATTFSGDLPTTDLTGTITNAQLAGSIENAKLSNSSIAIGGVTLNLGDTDATPAFNLSDATDYPTSSLSGTITNAQLAGSIADGKLASTFLKNVLEDTTPQLGGNLDFNSKFITGTGGINVSGVVTATTFSGNLPTTDLTGTITNAQLAGSIANAKLANSSIAIGGVTLNLGDTDATPAFDLSDATAYPTSSLSVELIN